MKCNIAENQISISFELTGLSRCAPAVEAADPVDAGSPIEAGGTGAVVDVDRAVRSCPAVHAYAGEAAHAVGAGGAVLAHRRPQRALVHVLFAKSPGVRGRALARVAVDAVDAGSAVLALVTRAVVDVLLAVLPSET